MKVMYKCSLERMSDKIRTFAKFGDAGHGGITRYSLSPEAHHGESGVQERGWKPSGPRWNATTLHVCTLP